jgi:DNA (cytosine-5)-methyltransferase 1
MVGLPIRRHRAFETNWAALPGAPELPPCSHSPSDYSFDHGKKQPESVYRAAMGCGWMTVVQSREAIPPAYTRWIGERLMERIERTSPVVVA